jgi:hypothetical protein
MDRTFLLYLNAVLGSLTVIVGLWLLVGKLPLTFAVILALGLAGLLAWWSPTIAHIWTAATLLLGAESLAWPVQEMIQLRALGPEPPLEDMERIFTAVLFGLFSGVFWMTFSYGIYKRIRLKANPPASTSSAGPSPVKKSKTKGKRKR